MRLQLLDDEDTRALEVAIARAVSRGVVSAVVALVRRGLWTAAVEPADTPPPPAPEAPQAAPPAPQETRLPPLPPPVFRVPEVRHEGRESHRRATSDRYAEVLDTIGHRPEGFIPLDDAWELLDGATLAAQKEAVKRWILRREVRAAIVTSYQAAGGLPGKICVSRGDVLSRNELRKLNAQTNPGRRTLPRTFNGGINA